MLKLLIELVITQSAHDFWGGLRADMPSISFKLRSLHERNINHKK
jgi:hypothetical protein